MYFRNLLFFSFIILLISGSCRKDLFTTDPSARLSFSTDTVHFDTVFVSIGSATKNFKVFNPSNQSVKISHIRLAGGPNSPYRINIDGRATTLFEDYELAGKDSMYIFVEVTVDPNNINQPYIVEDSILFATNGNEQKVILASYGQNAHFFSNEVIECNSVWTNDKPYVIYDSILILPGCKLTIEKGVKVYNHRRSGIFIAGTLEVNGTKDEPVIFRGDRLERKYEDEPGQWVGIRFLPGSYNNTVKHAVISNAIIGVEVDSLPANFGEYNLKIEKSIIRNMGVVGLMGLNTAIEAKNLLIHSCEQFTFYGTFGGNYKVTHCTFDNSFTKTARRTPSFVLTNFFVDDINKVLYLSDLKADFRNNIIWGNQEEELAIAREGTGTFDTTFQYNIFKTKDYKFNSTNFRNTNPRLESPIQDKYHLSKFSPAINAGMRFPEYPVDDDILGNLRDDKPDIGCYEFKE